jgi:DNA-binding XRE family transcriptional regulator
VEPVPRSEAPGDFDAQALFESLDRQRQERGLTWRGVADEIWAMSPDLNAERPHDHPIAPSTLTNLARNGDTSCQHALFFLRWLGRSPESFVPDAHDTDAPLPDPGPRRRPRWHLTRMYDALDEHRRTEGLTWAALAAELHCSSNQLTGLRTARYATSMRLAMRICRWLGRPAADFVDAGRW